MPSLFLTLALMLFILRKNLLYKIFFVAPGYVMPRIEHSMFIRCIIAAIIAVASRSPIIRAMLYLTVLNLLFICLFIRVKIQTSSKLFTLAKKTFVLNYLKTL